MLAPLIAVVLSIWTPMPVQQSPNQANPTISPAASQNVAAPANPPAIQTNQKQGDAGSENKEKDKRNWFDRFLDTCAQNDKAAIAVSTIAVAAFTFFLVVATITLWLSGARQSRRELRAYVSFTPSKVLNYIPLGQQRLLEVDSMLPVEIRFTMFNHGKTPAFNVRVHGDAGVFRAGLTQPPRRTPWQPVGGASIFPGASINQVYFLPRLTGEQIRAVELGTQRIYFWGVVIYRLAFRKFRSRRTWFFASVGGPDFAAAMHPRPPSEPVPTYNWTFGQRHNHST